MKKLFVFCLLLSTLSFAGCRRKSNSSNGLEFVSIKDPNSNVAYMVSKGTCTESNIVIPSSYLGKPVIHIGDFRDCDTLVSIEIPNSIISISSNAFYHCEHLTSVTIPNSITSIEQGTFNACTRLTSINIPNSVTKLGYYAFSNCLSLPSIEIPNSVTSIGDSAFKGCTSLSSIKIGKGVTSIGPESFSNCTSLTSITIPDSVTSIGYYAFYACTSLTSISIPDSLTDLGALAFVGCSSLAYTHYEKAYYLGNSNNPYLVLDEAEQSFEASTIVNTCKFIQADSFSYSFSSLVSLEIPNSVTFIGSGAFINSRDFESIFIPDSVTYIGSDAFQYCSSLTIYCEAPSKPSGWDEKWNSSNRPVVWGYQNQAN